MVTICSGIHGCGARYLGVHLQSQATDGPPPLPGHLTPCLTLLARTQSTCDGAQPTSRMLHIHSPRHNNRPGPPKARRAPHQHNPSTAIS